MMKEVLRRRFKKANIAQWPKPDLIILDGGKGQLSAAQGVFEELNIKDQQYICISKGPKRNAGEEYFHQINQESFTLKKDQPIMYYLQNLRDEAHRFAITSHRNKRAKSTTKSQLDSIKNIGAARKKLLLNHFGSVKAIKDASIKDLCRIDGISEKTANNIKQSL
jgi:excinuclease ABC subunit C